MGLSGDELAGLVDPFGALTREELHRAVREAAFRAGREHDRAAAESAIADAIDSYRLVVYDRDGEELVLVGPTAFPEPPDGAEDIPHIMDVEPRSPDRAAVGEAVGRRFRAETARAVDEGDVERIRHLLDVSYDLETWGPVDLGETRDRLDRALED